MLAATYGLELESFQSRPAAKRALVCVGKLFVRQTADALQAQGFELWSIDIQRHALEELARTVQRFDPEIVVSVNYTHGLAEFCHEHRRKLIVWEVDPTQYGIRPCQTPTPNVWIWTYRRSQVAIYRAAGFENVAYLPLAADPEVRTKLGRDHEAGAGGEELPVSFVREQPDVRRKRRP